MLRAHFPSDLANYICTFHNPHRTGYDQVVRELILKNLNETQLLLIKLTKKSDYELYFITKQDPRLHSNTLWLCTVQSYYDGSWGQLLCTHEEFMEFYDVKICYNWWKNINNFWWEVEELRALFDEEHEKYLERVNDEHTS